MANNYFVNNKVARNHSIHINLLKIIKGCHEIKLEKNSKQKKKIRCPGKSKENKMGMKIYRQFEGRFSKWHVTEPSTNPLTY